MTQKQPRNIAASVKALRSTFERRRTRLPKVLPFALTPEFAEDPNKQKQWQSFIQRGQLKTTPISLPDVITTIRAFVMPPSLAAEAQQMFSKTWIPGNQWFNI